jgi:hypothetical protein
MGEKLGYITSRDGTREKEASDLGTDMIFVEEVGAKYDEVAASGLVKLSEYNGGGAFSGIGRVGDAIARELELIGEEDGRA